MGNLKESLNKKKHKCQLYQVQRDLKELLLVSLDPAISYVTSDSHAHCTIQLWKLRNPKWRPRAQYSRCSATNLRLISHTNIHTRIRRIHKVSSRTPMFIQRNSVSKRKTKQTKKLNYIKLIISYIFSPTKKNKINKIKTE